MRHWLALVLALCTGLCLGCASGRPAGGPGWLDRFRKTTQVLRPDMVCMDVAILELPIGDAYINGGLWTDADEQIVALEQRVQLEDNGFRVGQIGGITPIGLQQLLTSERSCANPRRIQAHPGKTTELLLGALAAECRFDVYLDGTPRPLSLEQAQCVLDVAGELTPDGKTVLRFAPRVQHGETQLLPHPTPDRSHWMLKQDQPTESFEKLNWEVVLAPNEFLVIGGRIDQPRTLGHQCFVRTDEVQPVQRLLVIRTGRALPEVGGMLAGDAPRGLPLASQAAATTVRGASP